MNLIEKSDLTSAEKENLFKLWNQVLPTNIHFDTYIEFETYLNNLYQCEHLVAYTNKSLAGWLGCFERHSEKWFILIIAPKAQNKGLGTQLLHRAKLKFEQLNGWLIDHYDYQKDDRKTYLSPMRFFLKNDFNVLKEERLERELISAVRITWPAS